MLSDAFGIPATGQVQNSAKIAKSSESAIAFSATDNVEKAHCEVQPVVSLLTQAIALINWCFEQELIKLQRTVLELTQEKQAWEQEKLTFQSTMSSLKGQISDLKKELVEMKVKDVTNSDSVQVEIF